MLGNPVDPPVLATEVRGSENPRGAGNQQERPGPINSGILRDHTPDPQLRVAG